LKKTKGPGRKPLPTISASLSRRVREHEAKARRIFCATRTAVSGGREQWIANVLKRERRPEANRMPVRDAEALVALVSWPQRNALLWRSGVRLPTHDELRRFFDESWGLLREVAPIYAPPVIELPKGTGNALAPHLSKLLAGVVSRRLAHPDDRRTPIVADRACKFKGGTLIKTGRGLHELPGGKMVPGDLESALRYHLSRYEAGSSPVLSRGAATLETILAKPDAGRKKREHELFERLKWRHLQSGKRPTRSA
jgi:hypothetical protein